MVASLHYSSQSKFESQRSSCQPDHHPSYERATDGAGKSGDNVSIPILLYPYIPISLYPYIPIIPISLYPSYERATDRAGKSGDNVSIPILVIHAPFSQYDRTEYICQKRQFFEITIF